MGEDDTVTLRVRDMDVLTTRERWDELRGMAPVPASSEDMTDCAKSMLEYHADRARQMDDDALITAYGQAAGESIEGDVFDAEIERRSLSV